MVGPPWMGSTRPPPRRRVGLLLLLAGAASAGDEGPPWVSAFRRDGYAVLEGFASGATLDAMRARAAALVAERGAYSRESVFVTDDRQLSAQAASAQFFRSAERNEVFYEAGGAAANKIGHALHLAAADDVFGAYAFSPEVAAVLRAVGLRDARLPQSMYILKEAGVGGAVTAHQDATFLHTTPAETVVGLWLAVDDATLANGCLWARNGSHAEPVRRLFQRQADAAEPRMGFADLLAQGAEHYLDHRLLDAARRRPPNAEAAAWEGKDLTADDAARLGFTPLPVPRGSLVVLAGTLDHLSLPNTSPHPRHTFQLHAVEGPGAGVHWAPSNWLQYDSGRPFPAATPRADHSPHAEL